MVTKNNELYLVHQNLDKVIADLKELQSLFPLCCRCRKVLPVCQF